MNRLSPLPAPYQTSFLISATALGVTSHKSLAKVCGQEKNNGAKSSTRDEASAANDITSASLNKTAASSSTIMEDKACPVGSGGRDSGKESVSCVETIKTVKKAYYKQVPSKNHGYDLECTKQWP